MCSIQGKGYENIVIGGAGFIGSALCKKFVEEGESVLCVSRDTRKKFICEQKECDVSERSSEELKEIFKGAENIFILIGQIHSEFDESKEIENIKKVINSIDNSTKKVFYFSSALVYGEKAVPASENDLLNPIDEYSKFKVRSEGVVKAESNGKKWKLVILRLSNVYGNPQNKGFIGFILKQFFEKKTCEISINGDGKQARDYMFIDDVIGAVISVRDKIKNRDIINISTGKSNSLLELIEEIGNTAGKKIKYKILHNQTQEVKTNLVSNDKLKHRYDFAPKHDLRSGLKKTIENYKYFYKTI